MDGQSVMKSEELFIQSIQLNIIYWLNVLSKTPEIKYEKLISELPNLLRAIQFGISTRSTFPKSAKLLVKLNDLIEFSGTCRAWIPLLQKAVDNDKQNDNHIQCQLLNQLGSLLWMNDQIDHALIVHLRAAQTAATIQNKFQLAAAHYGLCQDYWKLQDYEKANRFAQDAITEFSKLEVKGKTLGVIFNALGIVAHSRQEYEAAEDYFKNSIGILRDSDNLILLARSLNNLAITSQEIGKYDRALKFFNIAANLLGKTHNELEKSKLEFSRASLHMKLGNLERAKSDYTLAQTQDINKSSNEKFHSLVRQKLGQIDILLTN